MCAEVCLRGWDERAGILRRADPQSGPNYNLSRIGQVEGGARAGWMKQGTALLGDLYDLDGFHLKGPVNSAVRKASAWKRRRSCACRR